MYLETSRLLIRPLLPTDLQGYHQLLSDPENMIFELTDPYPEHRSQSELTYWTERNLEFGSAFGTTAFGIELISENKLIGIISGLFIDTDSAIIELGILIDHHYLQNGYSFEALQSFIDYGFSHTDIHKLTARTDNRNTACVKLLEKVGMVREGLLRQNTKTRDGSYCDEAIYGMLKEDFHKNRRA